MPQGTPQWGEDQTTPPAVAPGPDVRPALGEPAEAAKTLMLAEAKSGVDVVRLVAGDPLSVDAVSTEVMAVSKSGLPFELRARPAGHRGGAHPCRFAARVDQPPWPTSAARSTGPRWPPRRVRWIPTATASHPPTPPASDRVRAADATPCVVTAQGTTRAQRSVESTWPD